MSESFNKLKLTELLI